VRQLSDSDVIAIVDALEERLTDKFYRDVGKVFWGLVWKAILSTAMFIATYGAIKYSNGSGT